LPVPEGQAHLDERALHPGGLVHFIDEARHQPVEVPVGRLEARDEELLQAFLDVTAEEGGQHGS
jgi:hypothetical protein